MLEVRRIKSKVSYREMPEALVCIVDVGVGVDGVVVDRGGIHAQEGRRLGDQRAALVQI